MTTRFTVTQDIGRTHGCQFKAGDVVDAVPSQYVANCFNITSLDGRQKLTSVPKSFLKAVKPKED